MHDKRQHIRYTTLAAAKIEDLTGGESLLIDLSITGCRIECPQQTEMDLNRQYQLEVIPENEAKVGSFMLVVEPKWIKSGANTEEIGLFILESPKGKSFLSYVDYLSWRYSQGSSMTSDDKPDIPSDV